MRIQQKPIVIFSVFRTNVPNGYNEKLHSMIKDHLVGLNLSAIELNSCYNGVKEKSILTHLDNMGLVSKLSKMFGQEQLMIVYEDGTVWFQSVESGEKKHAGSIKAVSPEEAVHSSSYTYRPDQDQFYVVKGN